MNGNTIRFPVEVLDESDAVMVEITDPGDGTIHTFTGSDDASVQRKIDEFWAIPQADEAAGQ